MLDAAFNGILTLPPALAYVVIGLLVFSEAAIFVGFVLPGETAVVLGGVLAARGSIGLAPLMVLVVLCAVGGDSVGYEVGRLFGERVLRWGALAGYRARIDSAREVLRRRGGSAVFLGRWTAFLRAVMPGLAGLSRMPYLRFLAFNFAGGLAWGVTFSLVGYLAGNSYTAVEHFVGRVGAVATAVIVIGALTVWFVRRRRREAEVEAEPVEESGAAPAARP